MALAKLAHGWRYEVVEKDGEEAQPQRAARIAILLAHLLRASLGIADELARFWQKEADIYGIYRQ